MVEQALAEVDASGPEATPALLARVAELSGGRSVTLNVKLVLANATTAARCARARRGRRLRDARGVAPGRGQRTR